MVFWNITNAFNIYQRRFLIEWGLDINIFVTYLLHIYWPDRFLTNKPKTRLNWLANKLKSRGFRASSLSTYDFSTLYTTLPHNLIKDKLVDLIKRTFQREGSLYIACNDRNAFFTSDAVRNYNLWSCQKVCEALTFLLDNIYIRFGAKLN